ncbi:MAG: ABC transporter substrate-binding protein [Deltaproteobacteria bacterium]|nr:ABC transporter substrate-binding protein [Deltaproteobacteria bacterium]MBW1950202.1 ABC transporter substrate-binding protein [Deltaproteobacteria bacterium]MBW2009850.1 ABC transporter substrate-binding protein [Deltaproteobacteria bacterium]
MNENFEPIPYLAKDWDVSPDRLTYTFHLVRGATFHDGSPITSEDVAFSFETVKKNHSFGPSMLGPVDHVETPDPYTAVFKLSKPHPAFYLVLSPPLLPILPRHVYNEKEHGPIRKNPANVKPVGSGPFKLVEYKPGDHFILERYENYFRPGKPYLDRIIGRRIKDPSANFIALKNGDFHMAMFNAGIRLKQLEALKKMGHLVVSPKGYEGIAAIYFLEFNLRKDQFKDVRVRRAIAHAIDKDFITKKLHGGYSRPATGPIHRSLPFYTSNVRKYEYNLEKANRLLDEAGFPRKKGGFRFSAGITWYPGEPDSMDTIAHYLKPQLKKIGIDLKLQPPADFVSWYRTVAGWKHDLTMSNIFSFADPMIGVHRLYRCDNQKHVVWTNTSGYCNPKLDQLMEKAAVEMDFEKRKALYARFQQILTEDLPLIWTHEAPYKTIYHKDLRNVVRGIWGSMTPADSTYWKDGHTPR